MGVTMKCVKYLLFFINLLFALSGFALIIAGGVIQGVYKEYLDFLNDEFFNTPVLLIIVGCVMFFITFFGCCGAIKENHCMILTFSILLGLMFVVELGAAIAAYVLKSDVRSIISAKMEKGLQNYDVEGYDGVTRTWNIVQHEMKCCGAEEYKDWANTTFSIQSQSVPDSCCLSDVQGCGKGILSKPEEQAAKMIYISGCLSKLENVIASNVAAIGGVGLTIALLQFVGLVFSCCLASSIKKEYETV